MHKSSLIAVATSLMIASSALSAAPQELQTGRAQHAFDHLGNIGAQADTVAASGGTIIYATGCGGVGYDGLPSTDALAKLMVETKAYNDRARAQGIKLILGYVCATSIVHLDTFDKNWSPAFRAKFKTPPAEWRQQDVNGKPLPSWYGGHYQPACMNNPDWVEYERFIVRQQLDAGHDGVFFDNPTVHPQGCYCAHCMSKFSEMLVAQKLIPANVDVGQARQLAAKYPKDFLRFRAGTARDFLAKIREFARSVKPAALVTCNNSLNTPDVLYAQAQTYGYNIYEMSKTEDLVVVEDMSTQPRLLPGGRTLEYGPTLAQLHAIAHGKPIVANELAEADNHTPPNLCRLAMVEAAAHDASYLSWPTWPEDQRARMSKALRAQADLLRDNANLLNDTQPRADVILFLPFRRWTETKRCAASELAAKLSAANYQYKVASEDDIVAAVTPAATAVPASGLRTAAATGARQVFLVESRTVLLPPESAALEKFESAGGLVIAADEGDWTKSLESGLKRSLDITAPPTVRAVVRDQNGRSIVHVYNLAIERLSSFDDKVTPASDITLRVRVPLTNVKSVKSLTADETSTRGTLKFTIDPTSRDVILETMIPKLEISTMLVIEP